MTPSPANEQVQQAQANNLSAGIGVPKVDGDLKVVTTEFIGGKLHVVIESGNPERLMSTASRNLAYAQRFAFGLTNAGIEALAGMYVPEDEMKLAKDEGRSPRIWHRDFRLTPGL